MKIMKRLKFNLVCVLMALLLSAVPTQTFGQQKNWTPQQIQKANKVVVAFMKHDTQESRQLAASAIANILDISLSEANQYIDSYFANVMGAIIDREERAKERLEKAFLAICDTCSGYVRKLYGGNLLTPDEMKTFSRFDEMYDYASRHLDYREVFTARLAEPALPVMRNRTIRFGDGSGAWTNEFWNPTVSLVGSTIRKTPRTNKTDTVFQFVVKDDKYGCCFMWYRPSGWISAYKILGNGGMQHFYINGDFRGFLPQTLAQYTKDSLELRNNIEHLVIARVHEFFEREQDRHPWRLRSYNLSSDLSRLAKKKAKPLPSYLRLGNLYFVKKEGKYDIWTFAEDPAQEGSYRKPTSEELFFSQPARRSDRNSSSGETAPVINNPVDDFQTILTSVHSPEDIQRFDNTARLEDEVQFLEPFIRNKCFVDMRDFFVEEIPRILSKSLLYKSYLCCMERNVQNTPNQPDHQVDTLCLFLAVDRQNREIYLVDGLKQQKVEITPSLRFLFEELR